jgi:DNA-binding response OmpR family regulator
MPTGDPVLLASDDDESIVATICAIGVRGGFRTVSVLSANRLRELVESTKPDIIVLDRQMPD